MTSRILAFFVLLFTFNVCASENLSSYLHEENFEFQTYDNGINTFIFSSKKSPERASFRIVIRRKVTENIDTNTLFFHQKDPFAIDSQGSNIAFTTHSLVTSEVIEYGMEAFQPNQERIETFFEICKEKILEEIAKGQNLTECKETESNKHINSLEKNTEQYLLINEKTHTLYPEHLGSITIIAVGDFDQKTMEDYFKTEFASIDFMPKEQPPALGDLQVSSLEDYWENYVLKALFYNKLKERSLDLSNQEIPFSASSFSPTLDSSLNTSPLFFLALDELSTQGISDKEFEHAIATALYNLDMWEEGKFSDPSCAIADAYAAPHGFKTRIPSIKEIKTKSIQIIKKLRLDKLWEKAKQFYIKEKNKLFPPRQQPALQVVGYKTAPKNPKNLGQSGKTIPYLKLPITNKEKKIIAFIVNTIAEKNVFQLLLKKSELTKKGDSIRHVHPFKFLETVFTDPKLTRNLKSFVGAYFKWSNFIDGLSEKLHQEHNKNNLLIHLPAFAQRVGIPKENLFPFVQKRDWEGMVIFSLKTLTEKWT